MYTKIVGVGPEIEGTSKKTGNLYHGQSLYMTHTKRDVSGYAVKEQFVSFMDMAKPPVFKVGDEVFMDFDDRGYLLSIEIVPPAK